MKQDPQIFLKHILESIEWKDLPQFKKQIKALLELSD